MKKLFLLLLILLSTITFADNNDYNRWSVSLETGLNKFDGDVGQTQSDILPTSTLDLVVGGQLCYSFNNICGLSVDYYYIPLKAEVKDYISVRTNVNVVTFNGVINFTHLFIPTSKSKLSLIGTVGMGYSIYDYNTTGVFPSPQATIAGKLDEINGNAITLPVSFSLQYDIFKNINLGGKFNYIAFNKDNLEGILYYDPVHGKTVYKGVTNDYIGIATVYLTYKFGYKTNKKNTDKKFLINKELDTYIPIKNDTIDNKIVDDKFYGNVYITNNIINNITNNTNSYNSISTVNSNNITYQDNIKDGCKTCIDSTIYAQNNGIDDKFIDNIPSIYFDFDKYNLDFEANKIIKKVADFMISNPEYYVEIRGYCDNMGNVSYNEVLSKNRTDIVKYNLVEYYNIPKNNIITNGLGKINEPPMKFRLNRRCDFFFYKVK